MSFERVAIVGVGLVGGSLALALKAGREKLRIVGVDHPSVLEAAVARGILDDGATDLERGVPGCDLVVLATPVSVIIDQLRRIGPALKPSAVVTDVGSTKRAVLAAASALPASTTFVGGHPMAGKVESGLGAADGALFRDAPWCLVPRPGTPQDALDRLTALVRSVGARPVVLDAETHDRAVALVSHLPQILALVLSRQATTVDRALDVQGPAFKSLARLAESSAAMWQDIFETNEDAIRDALAALWVELGDVERLLPDLRAYFTSGE